MVSGFHHFLAGFISIIVIDLLLCGDNALVIAVAVRALPGRQRRMALVSGAAFAVMVRVAVTFVAAKLLEVEFIQFAGGAFVAWIAVKVLTDANAPERAAASPHELWRAIGSIMLADLTTHAPIVFGESLRIGCTSYVVLRHDCIAAGPGVDRTSRNRRASSGY